MHRVIITIALGCLIAAVATAAPPQLRPPRPTIPPEVEERMARDRGYHIEPYVSRMTLPLPAPMLSQELDRYIATLILSEAQEKRLREEYEAYRDQDWEYRKAHAQPLWDRSAELSAQRGTGTIERAHQQKRLFEDCEPVLQQIITIENAFFNSLIPILAEEQLFNLERVRYQRARARVQTSLTAFPGCTFDLSQALHELGQRGYDMVPADRESFDELRVQYDVEMTSLAERIAKARERPQREGALLIAQAQDLLQNAEDREAVRPQALELESRRVRLLQESARLLRTMHDRNRSYITDAAARLEPETGAELKRMWKESAYRAVYPNPYQMDSFFEEILSKEELDEEIHDAITDVHASYAATVDRLSGQMVQRLLAWEEQFVRTFSVHIDEKAEYQAEMMRLQRERAQAASRALSLVLSLFGDEVPEFLESLADKNREQWAAADRKMEQRAASGWGWP